MTDLTKMSTEELQAYLAAAGDTASTSAQDPLTEPPSILGPPPTGRVPDTLDGVPSPGTGTVTEGFGDFTIEELQDMYASKGGDMTKLATPGVADYAQGVTGGFNSGIAEMAGLPVDLMASAMELVGVSSEAPVGGSEWIKRVYGQMESLAGVTPGSMTAEGPDTPTGRVLNRIGEELGASSLPAIGALGAGAKAARQAITIPKGGFKDAIQSTMRRVGATPGAALAGETVAAIGAGAGAGVANEIAPDDLVAELIGQIGGGIAPSALAGLSKYTLTGMATRFLRKLSPTARRMNAEAMTKEFLNDDMTTEALERLEQSQKVAGEIEGFQPTTAELTGTPGLLEAQRVLEKGATPQAVKRRIDNESAVARFSAENAPRAEEGLDFVVDSAKKTTDDLRSDLDTQAGKVRLEQEELASTLPLGDPRSEGALLRGALEGRFGDEQRMFSQYAQEAGLEDDSVVLDFKAMRKPLLQAYASATELMAKPRKGGKKTKKTKKPMAPGVPVLDRIRKADGRQTLPAILELRSDISKQLRDIDKMDAPDPKVKRGLTAMRNQYDELLKDAIERTGDDELMGNYREFNKRYREDIVEVFKTGATAKVLRKNARGTYITPDERVAADFFRPGHVSAANQYNSILSADPASKAAIRAVALDSLRRDTVRDGVIKDTNLQSWMNRHRTVLDEYPELRDELSDVTKLHGKLAARAAELNARKEAVGNRMLTRRLNSYSNATIPADRVLDDAITKPEMMGDLVTALRGEPEAMAALRRAVWNRVDVEKPGAIAGFLDSNKGSIDQVLSAKHREALKTVDAARAMMAQSAQPTPDVTVPNLRDKFVRQFGIAPDVLANRIHAINTGRSEKTWVVVNVLLNIAGRRQKEVLEDVMRTVLYDPQVAQDLASSLRSGKVSEGAAKRLGARWFALGLTPAGAITKDEDETP